LDFDLGFRIWDFLFLWFEIDDCCAEHFFQICFPIPRRARSAAVKIESGGFVFGISVAGEMRFGQRDKSRDASFAAELMPETRAESFKFKSATRRLKIWRRISTSRSFSASQSKASINHSVPTIICNYFAYVSSATKVCRNLP
jgi:hypothetical protein